MIDPRTRPEIYSGKVTIMGRGKLYDKKCAISGTIKIKFTTPAV